MECAKIKSGNKRERKYYARYLNHLQIQVPTIESCGTPTIEEINKTLSVYYSDPQASKSIVEKMKTGCSRMVLSNEDLNWIDKKDSRQCYWLWSYLYSLYEPQFHYYNPRRPSIPSPLDVVTSHKYTTTLYNHLELPNSPFSPEDKYQAIILYLDLWPADNYRKKAFNKHLKEQWQKIKTQDKQFKWLNSSNHAQAEWSWKYLQNYSKVNLTEDIQFTGRDQDLHWATLAAIDLWDASVDSKELFIIKMKKAWSQKKHRDGLKGKKAYNFVLSNTIKNKLNRLAKHNDSKLNETLEKLINSEFEKQFNN